MAVLYRLLWRPDIERVFNACEAGREGELIFAYIYELCRGSQPVERLWISSLTRQAIGAYDNRLTRRLVPRAVATPP